MKFRLWHLFLIIGIFFLIIVLMFLPVAISGFAGLEDSGSGEVVGLFSIIFCVIPSFIPTVIFLVLAVLFRQRMKKLAELAEMLRSYRCITMSDLARRMGRKEHRIRNAVKLAVKRSMVQGKFDDSENTFMTKEFIDTEPNVINGWKCNNCGNYNKMVILPGEVGKCEACGVMLERTADGIDQTAPDTSGPVDQQQTGAPPDEVPLPQRSATFPELNRQYPPQH